MNDEHRRIGVLEPGWFQRLQALEDAIAYRQARVTAPCPDCGAAATGEKCDDHACDVDLIAGYQRAASVVCGWIDAGHAEIARTRRHQTVLPWTQRDNPAAYGFCQRVRRPFLAPTDDQRA